MKESKGRIFAITGDGEINEGSIWEAALAASKHHLANLTLLRGELRWPRLADGQPPALAQTVRDGLQRRLGA
jgi:hypothetical protein